MPVNNKKVISFILLALILISSIILGIKQYCDLEEKRKETIAIKYDKWSGKLESPTISTSKYPSLRLGESGARINFTNNPGIFGLPTGDNLKFEIKNNKVVISTIFRDVNGDILVKIVDNIWHVVPSKTLDKNFNQNSLEVIDAKGEVLLQIQLIGRDICFAGIFYTKSGGAMQFGPWIHESQNRKNSLFKYPSTEFPGILSPNN
jgi:hypothetical protein